ncbi:delta(8)-fatty-acid desaturase [Aspergillus lentulus]|nr:delta(8)-fatty-acid desaturase [Aspergillus lentulus]GFF53296.1 delta(8)-fatty-acid desaturase [Aspergillus lentulus]GFF77922.1 delta(8)-fatty-acid desaturase [Aspergillus lentulus]
MSLFDYYSQHEEGEAQKYKGLMMSIYSRRTRLVGYDPIKDAVGPQLEILASSKAAPDPSKNMSAGQLREKAAARRAFYHAIEAKGFDISGFDSAGSSMDGGMLPEGNALLGQDKDVLETVLLAKRKMQSRFPERPDIDGARNLLYKVLEDDLFIGATPASRAAIHRTLSEVVEEGAAKYYERREWEGQKTGETHMGLLTEKDESEQDDTKEDFREGREGHWRQALYHWEQALDIESDAGFDKSTEEVERERVRTDMLNNKAAGLLLFDFDSIASFEQGQSPPAEHRQSLPEKQRRRRYGRCVVL